MKQSEIKVGKTYTNGKGLWRKVVSTEYPKLLVYFDCRTLMVFRMSLKSFASWAKAEGKEEADETV